MATSGEGSNNLWTWQQAKAFEKGLAMYPAECEGRWQKIASIIPGYKPPEEIKHHYQHLLDDVAKIQSGNVSLPNFPILESSAVNATNKTDHATKKGGKGKESSTKKAGNEKERRNGNPWTEVEHKQFLLGMERYGRGDWKTISKEFVKTRSPTQVASHAQKHFKKQVKQKKHVNRWSIFDITLPSVQGQPKTNYVTPSQNEPPLVAFNEAPPLVMFNEAPPLVVNEPDDIGNVVMPRPWSPPLSLPESWCLDSDDILDLEFQDCYSQLPPL